MTSILQILVHDWTFHEVNELNEAANSNNEGFVFSPKIRFSFL